MQSRQSELDFHQRDEEALKSRGKSCKPVPPTSLMLKLLQEDRSYYVVLEYLEGWKLFDHIVKEDVLQ
jgi:hypothetical protein